MTGKMAFKYIDYFFWTTLCK